MSQTTMEQNPRWDFADMILGGPTGKTVFIKHLNKNSDILSRPDILETIWLGCIDIAYDGKASKSKTGGPTGIIVKRDFAYEYKDEEIREVTRFRVSVQPSTKGVFFCMRRITGVIPTLQQQGFTGNVIEKLLQKNRRGLVLFGGEMGAGKTSAASATISEWLKRNGGSAVTLEDPPEYALQGAHVDKSPNAQCPGGICIQRATTADKMAEEIPTLMRAAAPEIIFLGEIREEHVAREAVLAAANGHLVISTIHGKGIEGSISRLISLGATNSMSYEETAKTIAEALSIVIFQRLVRNEKTNMKILQVTMADFTDEQSGAGMRNNLRTLKFEQMGNYLKEQQNRSSL